MHVMNLIAMGVGYASIAFTLAIVIVCAIFWVAGVTQRPKNIEKNTAARAHARAEQPTTLRVIQGARQQGKTHALSLIPGGRSSQC